MPRFLTFCSLTALALQPIGAQSLEESVRLMLQYEPELLAAHADTHSAASDIGVIRGGLLPQVKMQGMGGGVNRDRSVDGLAQGKGETIFAQSIGISLRQLLYDGGTALYETRSAKHALAVQNYMEKAMIEARVVDLAEVYLEVLRTGLRLTEAQKNIATHQRIREQVNQRASAGGTRTDTSLVDSRLLQAKDALVTEELARRVALDRFERLIGRPLATIDFPRIPKMPPTREEIDLSRNWSYLSAQSALKATEDKKEAVDRSSTPKLFLDAGLNQGRDLGGIEGVDDEARALITLQWDLLNGGARDAAQKREGWQVIRAHELVRAADLERQYRLTLLWRERESDLAYLTSLRAQVDFLEQVANDFESQFGVGKRDLLDILDSWNRHYAGKNRLIDSDFNLKTGAYRILGVQGRLVEFLLGPEGWDQLVPPDGKAVMGEFVPVASIPHPHHPEATEISSTHSMKEAPHEKPDYTGETADKGLLRKTPDKAHNDESPVEPKRNPFQRSGTPVATKRPATAKHLR